MSDVASADPPSVPRRRRVTLVLTNVLAGLVATLAVHLAVKGLDGSLPLREALLLTALVSAPLAAALAWSTVARWDDRVELWADRLLSWERGRPESYVLADVARLDARLSTVRRGLDLDTPVGLRVVMADGRALDIDGLPLRRARPLMQLVGGVLLERWYATLRRGGSVVCADAPPFPWALAGLAALIASSTAFVLAHQGQGALLTVLRGALLLASTAAVTRRALRVWWAARRTGGVEMSAAGITPRRGGAAAGEERLDAAPYRAAPATAGWTPWSAVGDVYIDGFGMWVHCADRPEALALSARAENFFVVNELIAAMRTARLTRAPAKG